MQFGPKIEKEKDQKKKLDESNEKLAALDRQLDELNSVQKNLEDGIKEMELSKSDLKGTRRTRVRRNQLQLDAAEA